jgi:hypothetical protein
MTSLFGWLVRKNWQDLGRNPSFILISDGLSAIAMLLVFWFTSKAMGHSFASGYVLSDYFSFVVMGETLLYVPSVCFSGVVRAIRNSAADGTLEPILVSRRSSTVTFGLLTLAWIPQELGRCLLMWILAAGFFTLRFSAGTLSLCLLTQIVGIPVFLGMGLWAGAGLVRFGRGAHLLAHLNLFASVFAGAYFPLAVFPDGVRRASEILSPFTVYVETGRAAFGGGPMALVASGWAKLLGAGVVLLLTGAWALGRGFEWQRRSGRPLLLTQ